MCLQWRICVTVLFGRKVSREIGHCVLIGSTISEKTIFEVDSLICRSLGATTTGSENDRNNSFVILLKNGLVSPPSPN